MNSTLGNVFILCGLAFAAFGAVVGIASGMMQREGGAVWVRRAVYGFFAFMLRGGRRREGQKYAGLRILR